jgi:hypothetical protein
MANRQHRDENPKVATFGDLSSCSDDAAAVYSRTMQQGRCLGGIDRPVGALDLLTEIDGCVRINSSRFSTYPHKR